MCDFLCNGIIDSLVRSRVVCPSFMFFVFVLFCFVFLSKFVLC